MLSALPPRCVPSLCCCAINDDAYPELVCGRGARGDVAAAAVDAQADRGVLQAYVCASAKEQHDDAYCRISTQIAPVMIQIAPTSTHTLTHTVPAQVCDAAILDFIQPSSTLDNIRPAHTTHTSDGGVRLGFIPSAQGIRPAPSPCTLHHCDVALPRSTHTHQLLAGSLDGSLVLAGVQEMAGAQEMAEFSRPGSVPSHAELETTAADPLDAVGACFMNIVHEAGHQYPGNAKPEVHGFDMCEASVGFIEGGIHQDRATCHGQLFEYVGEEYNSGQTGLRLRHVGGNIGAQDHSEGLQNDTTADIGNHGQMGLRNGNIDENTTSTRICSVRFRDVDDVFVIPARERVHCMPLYVHSS
jgi:hypothetical protein